MRARSRVLSTVAVACTALSAACASLIGIEDLSPGIEDMTPRDDGGAPDGSLGDGDARDCVQGEQRCSGGGIETCGTGGQWSAPWPCASGACSNGACTQPTTTNATSCQDGGRGAGDNCGGKTGKTSCCASLEVPGGSFFRDGNQNLPATMSNFRLDAYEVTVGRFRKFVAATKASPSGTPTPGSGIHAHLNGGRGLQNSRTGGGEESGWQASWPLPTSWPNLTCSPTLSTWTAGDDNLPMNCANWYEAYAFCIWDGGFLPSEAELNYAFMGGEDRTYPWGTSASSPGPNTVLAVYGCYYPTGSGTCSGGTDNIAPVGSATQGNGKWGQSDLAGNIWEWGLDLFDPIYASSTCHDCADAIFSAAKRVARGGCFNTSADSLVASGRNTGGTPDNHNAVVGFRCARTP